MISPSAPGPVTQHSGVPYRQHFAILCAHTHDHFHVPLCGLGVLVKVMHILALAVEALFYFYLLDLKIRILELTTSKKLGEIYMHLQMLFLLEIAKYKLQDIGGCFQHLCISPMEALRHKKTSGCEFQCRQIIYKFLDLVYKQAKESSILPLDYVIDFGAVDEYNLLEEAIAQLLNKVEAVFGER